MKVVFFHRKPRVNNFSVENLFTFVRRSLPPEVDWEVKEMKYLSKGFFPRLYICLEAAFSQKGINHVTGDINFIALFLRKRRTVLTLLDLGLLNHPNPLARWILKMFWIVLPVKRSRAITTISRATKIELLKHVKIDPSRVHVVYVPISDKFIFSAKIFNKEKPTILQIGTKPNKNVIRLVKALAGIECTLEIVGDVSEELLNELTANKVEFRRSSGLSNEEVLIKYISADIVSFVSTYEGFGMPIVEANATGRAVVTSNILSMPEVGGDAACFVNPFDTRSIREGILKVINDDTFREKLIMNGLSNRNRFDATMIARQFTDIYRSLE